MKRGFTWKGIKWQQFRGTRCQGVGKSSGVYPKGCRVSGKPLRERGRKEGKEQKEETEEGRNKAFAQGENLKRENVA